MSRGNRLHSQLTFLILAFACQFSAQSAKADEENKYEVVFRDSAKVELKNGQDTLVIEAIDALNRIIYHNNCIYKVKLWPRVDRWYGNLGGYNAAPSYFNKDGCNGISRIVISEGQIHFDNREFALEWLSKRPRSYNNVHGRQGLVVSWGVNLQRSQIGIDIDLMCFDGVPFDSGMEKGEINKFYNNEYKNDVIYKCNTVSKNVVDETVKIYTEDWKKYWK